MEERFAVVASEESYLQKDDGKAPRLPHRWTPGAVGLRSTPTRPHGTGSATVSRRT